MPDSLSDAAFEEVYEASGADLVHDFYIPALDQAHRYDRAVGYFRSSVFHLIGVALSDFALRDSRMRIICSPSLTSEDAETIRKTGRTSEDQIAASISRDVEAAIQSVEEHSVVQLLATLLEHGILDLKLTFKPDVPGIFHTKVGILRQEYDSLSFSGSANETFMAWAGNEERFHVFCSWRTDYEARQVAKDQDYFDRLWSSKVPDLVTRRLPEVSRDLLLKHALEDPEAAIERVRVSLLDWRRPSLPKRSDRVLQKHQAESRINWWTDQRGIVCYVTGGGKTITALEIIEDWFRRYERGSVVVLVPSNLLAKQWHEHLSTQRPRLKILQVGGDESNKKWRELLGDYTREAHVSHRRVVLAVMNSAASAHFVAKGRISEHTLLVADEVHRVGAPHLRRVLELEAGGRLGLSATPERFGDPDGTAVVMQYFGPRLEPRFTFRDAQHSIPPRLVPYTYHPETVSLTATELEQYRVYSKRIAILASRLKDSSDPDDEAQLKLALIQRAKVLKSASGKVPLGLEVTKSHYTDGARWLVYCDDTTQLDTLMDALKRLGHRPLKYHSAMAFSKEATIHRFEKVGGILLSINCLDEGIDIPSVTHALILASSINPRQYIQRRGRVLRASPGKLEATIFDALVQPDPSRPKVIFDQDLSRAREFAADAANGRTVARRLGAYKPFTDDSAAPWTDFEDDGDLGEVGD